MSFPYCKFANEDNKYDKTLKMKNNTMIIACLCAVGIMNVSMLMFMKICRVLLVREVIR